MKNINKNRTIKSRAKKRLKKLIFAKYKWLIIGGAAFFILLILVPTLFVIFLSSDSSSEEETLVAYTADDRMIEAALELEKDYGGSWIGYMTCEYILNGFNFEEIGKSKFRELSDRLENETLREILGDNYELYIKMKDYFEAIYDGIAEIEETYTNTDENSEDKEKTRYEMKCKIYHPYPEGYTYEHYNDFGADRSFGGERSHKGNDIMADEGTPIVAVASGYVERIGWETLGGWRIGIRDDNNRYWYYAHMKEYAPGIEQNKYIEAGEVIGFVGDSGYGPPGTTGQFAPHLHIQIGVMFPEQDELIYINPYGIIQFAERNKLVLDNDEEGE